MAGLKAQSKSASVFSVVMPAFDVADTVEAAIRSALLQTREDFEVIWDSEIDDGTGTPIWHPAGPVRDAHSMLIIGYDREPDTMNRFSTHILEDNFIEEVVDPKTLKETAKIDLSTPLFAGMGPEYTGRPMSDATPMMQQYRAARERAGDAVLLFRLGFSARAALFGALLFAVHPVSGWTVASIAARSLSAASGLVASSSNVRPAFTT